MSLERQLWLIIWTNLKTVNIILHNYLKYIYEYTSQYYVILVLKIAPLGTLPFHFHFTGIRTRYYLIGRHPIETTNPFKSIIKPFDKYSWLANAVSLLALTLALCLLIWIYKWKLPQNVMPNVDLSFVVIRSVFGVTEPDPLPPVDQFASSGKLLC